MDARLAGGDTAEPSQERGRFRGAAGPRGRACPAGVPPRTSRPPRGPDGAGPGGPIPGDPTTQPSCGPLAVRCRGDPPQGSGRAGGCARAVRPGRAAPGAPGRPAPSIPPLHLPDREGRRGRAWEAGGGVAETPRISSPERCGQPSRAAAPPPSARDPRAQALAPPGRGRRCAKGPAGRAPRGQEAGQGAGPRRAAGGRGQGGLGRSGRDSGRGLAGHLQESVLRLSTFRSIQEVTVLPEIGFLSMQEEQLAPWL